MRLENLLNTIATVNEMSDADKAELRHTLETCSEKTFLELEAVYVYGLY